jgi:hypothetical protein
VAVVVRSILLHHSKFYLGFYIFDPQTTLFVEVVVVILLVVIFLVVIFLVVIFRRTSPLDCLPYRILSFLGRPNTR